MRDPTVTTLAIMLTPDGHFCAYLDLAATGTANKGRRQSPRCRRLHDGCRGYVQCDCGGA